MILIHGIKGKKIFVSFFFKEWMNVKIWKNSFLIWEEANKKCKKHKLKLCKREEMG